MNLLDAIKGAYTGTANDIYNAGKGFYNTEKNLASTLGNVAMTAGKGFAEAPRQVGNLIAYPIVQNMQQQALNSGKIDYNTYRQTVDQAMHNAKINTGDSWDWSGKGDMTLGRKVAAPIAQTTADILTAGYAPKGIAGASKLGGVLGGVSGALTSLGQQGKVTPGNLAISTLGGAGTGAAVGAGLGAAGHWFSNNPIMQDQTGSISGNISKMYDSIRNSHVRPSGLSKLSNGETVGLGDVINHPFLERNDVFGNIPVQVTHDMPYNKLAHWDGDSISLMPGEHDSMELRNSIVKELNGIIEGKLPPEIRQDAPPIKFNPEDLKYGNMRDQMMTNPHIKDKEKALQELYNQMRR